MKKIEPSKKLSSLPPYAFAEIGEGVEKLRALGVQPIDFGVGDPTEPAPDFVIKAVATGAKQHAASGYPSYVGSRKYREAAAGYMRRRFGVSLNSEREICATIGSKEAVFNFPEGFINPGDVVICPSPGYPPMKVGTVFAGGVPFFVPLLKENDFLIDYKSIPEAVARRAKILWLNYPNSPTGATAEREYYKGLIEWAHRNEILIAADEGCYIDIYFDRKPPSILEVSRDGIIAFYSLSKRNNMTGYRVGFVCGDEKMVDVFKRLKTNIDSGVPDFVQEAAIAALADDAHVEGMRRIYREKRDILLPALRDAGLDVAESAATFYIWQKVPGDDVEFAKKLLDPSIGIVVTPGGLISDVCDGGVNPGKGYVRFALMPSLEDTRRAARKIRALRGNP
ncbi:MAG: aminotransferase class I/II-fold pyridoxal phosphate-dependent enzyme [bacterium]|nr:aminotransferase class I/II-fold pyridoxal phosphate-dependent enzyme [bacterium]